MVERGDETRERMLEAGVAQVHDASLTDLLSFLRPADLAAQAGRSKSTFFHHWPTFEHYVHDLMAFVWVAPQDDPALRDALADTSADLIDPSEPSIVAWVRNNCLVAFDDLSADPRLPLRFLGPVSGDLEYRQSLVERYRELDDSAGHMIETYLSRLDYSLREPFSGSSLALTVSSLLLGLTMRARVDPERVTAMLYADVVAALLPVLVAERDGDALPFDEFVEAAMMRPAAAGSSAMPGFEVRPRGELRALAQQATSQLRSVFAPELERALEHDLGAEDHHGIAAAHLRRLHALARQHPATALAALGASVAGRLSDASPMVPDALGESGLQALTARALQTAHSGDPDIAELAASANQWMLRVATGLDPLDIERVIQMVVPEVN